MPEHLWTESWTPAHRLTRSKTLARRLCPEPGSALLPANWLTSLFKKSILPVTHRTVKAWGLFSWLGPGKCAPPFAPPRVNCRSARLFRPSQTAQQPVPEPVSAFPGQGRIPDGLAGVNPQGRESFAKEFELAAPLPPLQFVGLGQDRDHPAPLFPEKFPEE